MWIATTLDRNGKRELGFQDSYAADEEELKANIQEEVGRCRILQIKKNNVKTDLAMTVRIYPDYD